MDFTAINMKKKNTTELDGYVYEFFGNYNIIDASNIVNIHKCLMEKPDIK